MKMMTRTLLALAGLWSLALVPAFAAGSSCGMMPAAGQKAATAAPHAMMAKCRKMCTDCKTKLTAALKALADGKKAAENGDAKAAAAQIAQAEALIAQVQKNIDHCPVTAAAKKFAEVVNSKCPIMGGKVNPNHTPVKLTRMFHGKRVGFCCPMCPPKWDKLTDAQKQAKLAAVTK